MNKCAWCGEAFEPYRSNQKYCSTKCRRKANNLPKKYPKVCPECGDEFVAKWYQTRYCPKCGIKATQAKRLASIKRNREAREREKGRKVDPKWLRRWGDKGPEYIGKASCFDGEKL